MPERKSREPRQQPMPRESRRHPDHQPVALPIAEQFQQGGVEPPEGLAADRHQRFAGHRKA